MYLSFQWDIITVCIVFVRRKLKTFRWRFTFQTQKPIFFLLVLFCRWIEYYGASIESLKVTLILRTLCVARAFVGVSYSIQVQLNKTLIINWYSFCFGLWIIKRFNYLQSSRAIRSFLYTTRKHEIRHR